MLVFYVFGVSSPNNRNLTNYQNTNTWPESSVYDEIKWYLITSQWKTFRSESLKKCQKTRCENSWEAIHAFYFTKMNLLIHAVEVRWKLWSENKTLWLTFARHWESQHDTLDLNSVWQPFRQKTTGWPHVLSHDTGFRQVNSIVFRKSFIVQRLITGSTMFDYTRVHIFARSWKWEKFQASSHSNRPR